MATPLLLADDSPTISKILQMALQSEDYEIRAVLTAEDALRELRTNPPFFFLVDLTLPSKNGYEFARLIRADSKLSAVRVVLLASAFEPVDEAEVLDCGADAVIKKPFDPAELRTKLRNILDAPPRFPEGTRVSGSLSGFLVTGSDDSTLSIPPSSLPKQEDTLSTLIEQTPTEDRSADSILAGLLGQPAGAAPPFFASLPAGIEPEKTGRVEFTNATVALDLSGQSLEEGPPGGEALLDLSSQFAGSGGTAQLDLSAVSSSEPPARPPAEPLTPASPDAAKSAEAAKTAEAPLSANAQALAAFFAAEIQSQSTPATLASPAAQPEAPSASPVDSFESSLGSIEWEPGPLDSSLDEWSSSQPRAASPSAETPRQAAPKSSPSPTPAARQTPPLSPAAAPAPAAAQTVAAKTPARGPAPSGGAAAMFDLGGSTFRFSDDYVDRLSKAFTGALGESLPEAHPRKQEAPFFPQQSDDRPRSGAAPSPPQAAAPLPAAAWSQEQLQRMDQVVREEVQMAVREVIEKVAWELIPELAENLIRKELEKVLKEIGPE